jgi:S1-C subfamily serine protease
LEPGLSQSTRQLVQAAEAALAGGDVEAARNAFDQAARMVHAPEVELGLVRTYMQAGEYRRALAFAAHAAGAHRAQLPAGSALYAWLLQLAGQGRVASATLAAALKDAPQDAALQQAAVCLADPWPSPTPLLTQAPWRVAPCAWGEDVAPDARVCGSGVVMAGGRVVCVPALLLGAARQVWVRNGLGQTVPAEVFAAAGPNDLAQLRLLQSLAQAQAPLAQREPYGGSPGYSVEFAPGPGALAAWPLLRAGFLGRAPRGDERRLLGLDMPRGPRGGPVFDATGQLVGIAIADEAGQNRLLPVAEFASNGTGDPQVGLAPNLPRLQADEIYERALSVVVQIIIVE